MVFLTNREKEENNHSSKHSGGGVYTHTTKFSKKRATRDKESDPLSVDFGQYGPKTF